MRPGVARRRAIVWPVRGAVRSVRPHHPVPSGRRVGPTRRRVVAVERRAVAHRRRVGASGERVGASGERVGASSERVAPSIGCPLPARRRCRLSDDRVRSVGPSCDAALPACDCAEPSCCRARPSSGDRGGCRARSSRRRSGRGRRGILDPSRGMARGARRALPRGRLLAPGYRGREKVERGLPIHIWVLKLFHRRVGARSREDSRDRRAGGCRGQRGRRRRRRQGGGSRRGRRRGETSCDGPSYLYRVLKLFHRWGPGGAERKRRRPATPPPAPHAVPAAPRGAAARRATRGAGCCRGACRAPCRRGVPGGGAGRRRAWRPGP